MKAYQLAQKLLEHPNLDVRFELNEYQKGHKYFKPTRFSTEIDEDVDLEVRDIAEDDEHKHYDRFIIVPIFKIREV